MGPAGSRGRIESEMSVNSRHLTSVLRQQKMRPPSGTVSDMERLRDRDAQHLLRLSEELVTMQEDIEKAEAEREKAEAARARAEVEREEANGDKVRAEAEREEFKAAKARAEAEREEATAAKVQAEAGRKEAEDIVRRNLEAMKRSEEQRAVLEVRVKANEDVIALLSQRLAELEKWTKAEDERKRREEKCRMERLYQEARRHQGSMR